MKQQRTGIFMIALILAMAAGCSKPPEGGGGYGPMVVNVVAYTVQEQNVSDQISLVGTLRANEFVEIKSEVDGVIEEIGFEEGELVTAEHVLFRIDEKKLQASLDQAKANLDLARTNADRYESLVEGRAVSRQEYDQAVAGLEVNKATVQMMEEQLQDATIRAAFDGIMGERLVSVGQFVTKGTLLSFLVSQNPMKASVSVPERFLSRVEIGQTIDLDVAAYPQERFTGEVYFIASRLDEQTRTAQVKAYVENPEGRLKAGMFAGVNLTTEIRENALVIPETALIVQGDGYAVYVVGDEQTVAMRTVEPGIRFNGMVEIVSGLKAGDVVVTEGYQKIREGSQVNPRFEDEAS